MLFMGTTIYSIYTMTQLGPIEFDKDVIRYSPLGRQYQITWAEITTIEFDQGGNAIVFHGSDQQLSVPGLMLVKKQPKEHATILLDSQIRSHQIQSTTSWKAMFRWQKNTKVKS